jgi:tetratricopeptide (TPR) repeat protein
LNPFELPAAPLSEEGPVKAWLEPVVIPAYPPEAPDKNPMFLEKRVYQGSSGRVYPLPFTDRISTERCDRSWQAAHIENEFVRLMVLPEIGGRIHVGLDKTNSYNFFYRQNVIKPALVGLAGPWISGGVELNWPQHHRPATFLPVQVEIEEHPDGSRTIWCSDHDPMNRMKGMHGICLHPGKSYLELKVRLFNRTPFVQTFLWWANVAARVHELYQSFFPPDVHYVADHARRAMSSFPLCNGTYYGVDYAGRADGGVTEEDLPRQFVPGAYPANDLSWYANIPVPTSYMAVGSKEDFLGGYDYRSQAGLIHVANHHISPGKKQWTWGNQEFGYTWDRNLTDEDGPYIELMAGVYTDNQPDFSFLAPYETRTFSQYWYPIQKIGPAGKANLNAAVSLSVRDGWARVGVCVSGDYPKTVVELQLGANPIAQWTSDLAPGAAMLKETALPAESVEDDLTLIVVAANGQELIRYTPRVYRWDEVPSPATEPPLPTQIRSTDELYLTGLHLEQYRHATRSPESYWLEALRRDPCDARSNNAMGLRHLRCGEFSRAEAHFRESIVTLTRRNPNPYDGEPYYNQGLALRFLGRDDEAYDAFYKATWSYGWRAPGYYALAEMDVKRGDWDAGREHLQQALRVNADLLNARNLEVVLLRRLNLAEEAHRLLRETLALDPLDAWARYLQDGTVPGDNQMRFDLALDYARAGLYGEAIDILRWADAAAKDGSVPILLYAQGYFEVQRSNPAAARLRYAEAAEATPDYCFPSRLEEMVILEHAVQTDPADARALYYLGNFLYDRRRHKEAIRCWEHSTELDDSFPVAWRNLGIAYFNVFNDSEKARQAFDRSLAANPTDARVLYERDQLCKRIGQKPSERLAELEKSRGLVRLRDDLSIELTALYNQTGQPERALECIESRKFQPWEGGEGLVLEQHERTYLALGRKALAAGNSAQALRLFEAALACPENLGEARHPMANSSDIFYWLGEACQATGDQEAARRWWDRAANCRGDFQAASVQVFSEMTYYSALALEQRGRRSEAEKLLRKLLEHAEGLLGQEVKIDYFATSLPAMLLFNDDLQQRQVVKATFLKAQALSGLGRPAQGLLEEVLRLDRNHAMAADLLAELELESLLRPRRVNV